MRKRLGEWLLIQRRLRTIKARLLSATPGPWSFVHGADHPHRQLFPSSENLFDPWDRHEIIGPGAHAETGIEASAEDLEFIANAPADIQYLLDAVNRQTHEIAELKNRLRKMGETP